MIQANGTGTLRFGLVQAEIDCRMEDIGGTKHLAFTFAEFVIGTTPVFPRPVVARLIKTGYPKPEKK